MVGKGLCAGVDEEEDEMFDRKSGTTPVVTETYQMQQKMLSFGDDFWIENGVGQRVFRINGKALRLRRTFRLEDAGGRELLDIHSKILRLRQTFVIERDGETVATLSKALIKFRDRFTVDVAGGEELHVRGNIVDHDYAISRNGVDIARVSKRWIRARDTYGISISSGEDVPLLLAIAVCIDATSHADR
ncbi:LURP-one-related/scramblase family protein [Actinocorallia libanotica]